MATSEKESRKWCFTLNNYTALEKTQIKNSGFEYLMYGKEICPKTGTPHLQGWFYLKDAKTLAGIKKIPGFYRMHLEAMKRGEEKNEIYCRKDGKVFSYGKIPKQGTRNDLRGIKERLIGGDCLKDVILEDCNNLQQLRYAECLQKYIKPPKRETPEIYWYVGNTGSGKSYKAEKESGEEAFWIEPDGEWWDGYFGQENVVWDEFRGQIPLHKLLRLLDRYPMKNKTKGGFTNMNFKRIWITSCKLPGEIYKNCGENIEQLESRITIMKKFKGKNRRKKCKIIIVDEDDNETSEDEVPWDF